MAVQAECKTWESHYRPIGQDTHICHHKSGAGAFARLLKIALATDAGRSVKRAFIDSDDLRDLSLLFEYVANQTDMLIVVCTKEILSRQWCVGEIISAHINSIATAPLVLPDFMKIEDAYINDYAQIVPDIAVLTEVGMSVNMVQDSLRWIRELPKITMPKDLSQATIGAAVKGIVLGASQALEIEPLKDAQRQARIRRLPSDVISPHPTYASRSDSFNFN